MPSIDDGKLPHYKRPDLTPFLVHLTRETDEYDGFDNLESILREGCIRGTTKYFLSHKKQAACFMDIPFMALKYVCSEDNSNRYGPYGVVISKFWAYRNRDARPVLYLSAEEVDMLRISKDQLWRVVTLEASKKRKEWKSNWLHEREWRAPGKFSLPKTIRAVLVKTTSEARRLQKRISRDPEGFQCIPKSIIPLEIMCQGLVY